MGDCKREFHISGNYIESQVINNTFYDQSQYVSNDAVVESTSATDKDQVANAGAPCQAGKAQTEINSFMDVLTARPTGQDRYDDLYSAGAYDGSVNRYDLESDGLTVRNPRGFGK